MPLPTPVFSSALSSALSIFCQSTKHVFSPVRINRKLPASGLFTSLGTQTATLVPKVGPIPRTAVPRDQPPPRDEEERAALEARLKGNGIKKSGIQSQG